MSLAHQQKLEASITAMTKIIQSSTDTPTSLREGIDEAQRDIQGLKSFFSDFLSPTLHNEVVAPQDDAVAHRVFDVPELLELILLELPIADIMSFQQVDRNARDAIEASPALRRALSLQRDAAGSPLRMPFSNTGFSGFSCGPQDRWRRRPRRINAASNELQITADFAHHGKETALVGSRWRRMPRAEPRIITAECGITIGDLYDAAQTLWLEHRQCANAGALQLDEDGLVRVQVSFSAKIDLKPNDPIFVERQREAARSKKRALESAEQNALVQAYIVYKRAVCANGGTPLLLKEFDAAGRPEVAMNPPTATSSTATQLQVSPIAAGDQ
ncbi:hypothetical protein LTR85_008292 [Meristemomyces frigidus]|nr:hypothetical protein LTR85_008292 [Meristemomyces frigidus]